MTKASIIIGAVLGVYSLSVDSINSRQKDEKIKHLEIKSVLPPVHCDFSAQDTVNAYLHGYDLGFKSCKPEIVNIEKKANIHFESKDLKFETYGDTVKYSLFRDPDTTKGFGKISRTVIRISK